MLKLQKKKKRKEILMGDYHKFLYKRMLEVFYCEPKNDSFPSSKNYQIDEFLSWHFNRNTMVVDAFSIS